ncbi:Hypothetical predicted protein [Pelobates cultripes]|uniref:Reverse transcriptase domain-containing protein n=1 Tax=Pelobates cultripes TaxID=61616 RepID=A0AAD1WIG3_PELCU|nr:Hypothetical predicted protein [Pelobates cultripes]
MGNKAGKLLANQLKSKYLQTKIPYILSKSQIKIYNPTDIVNELASFYEELYNLDANENTHTPDKTEILTYLEKIQLPKISQQQNNALTTPFTESEVAAAIKSLPRHKAPGPDGLPNYYYLKLEPYLSPHITKLFNKIKETGHFPRTMLEAYVITLPKPNKPPTSCGNLRPISLLNADVKLYAKLVATRLKPLLSTLVSEEQAGFTIPDFAWTSSTGQLVNVCPGS